MNCKPGELAIVAWDAMALDDDCAAADVRGTIVETIKYVGNYQVNAKYICEGAWLVNSCMAPNGRAYVSDSLLRPIRPPEQPVVIGQLEGIKERV